MDALAVQFGVSRQRIHQIIRRKGGADAGAARAARREQRNAQEAAAIQAFLDQYRGIIADLAASGTARADIEDRFSLLLPGIPFSVVRDGLATAGIIFNADIQEYAFPTAAVESAVWFAIAKRFQVEPDLRTAMHHVDPEEGAEVAAVLDRHGIEAEIQARILIMTANARAHAASDPAVTISRRLYDKLRGEILSELGLVSARGATVWPPSGQTVMTRLGGGYWAEALISMGLPPGEGGRERGLLRFTENDYENAVADFLASVEEIGHPSTYEAFSRWIDGEERTGRRRPSAPAVRLHFTSWNNARRIMASPGAPAPGRRMRETRAPKRLTAGTFALHKAQSELERFLAQLEDTARAELSAAVDDFIKGYWQEFERSRRDWLRSVIGADPGAVSRRLGTGALPRHQREALQLDPPDLVTALSDIYLDRMLSGKTGGPRNTDSWLPPQAQAELDALPDDVIGRVSVLHEIRNFLVHGSDEARGRLQEALGDLATRDSRFTLRRNISWRILLDWLTSDQKERLQSIIEAIPAVWRAMVVVESVLESPPEEVPEVVN